MKTRPRLLLFFLVLSTCVAAIRALTPPFEASARLVRARIERNGVELLRVSTSDDGYPDVDEVWDYLGELEFEPTEAFGELGVDSTSAVFRLLGTEGESRGSSPYYERDIVLAIAYGGDVSVRKLDLVRSGARWKVSPEHVERYFDYRKITREQARGLKRPRRER